MWAVIVVSIIIAFLVYIGLTASDILPGGSSESLKFKEKSSSEVLSIGENPTSEDTKMAILSNGLETYKMKSLSSFTVSIFIKVNYIPRTGTFIDCDTDLSTQSGGYDCKNAKFPKCKLTGSTNNTDCKRQGYRYLFRIGNAIRLELLETQNPQRPGMARAQLSVQTQQLGQAPILWMETFSLPEFPLQKWIMLTIVRKGNVYSVYYNDRVVGSFKTENVPYINTTKVQLGDSSVIKGSAVYLTVYETSLSSMDITSKYTKYTDTNGQPKLPIFPAIKPIDLCVSGNCFEGPAVKPANPFVQWTQEYS